MEYRLDERTRNPPATQSAPHSVAPRHNTLRAGDSAAAAQRSGLAKLRSLSQASLEHDAASSSGPSEVEASQEAEDLTEEELSARRQKDVDNDRKIVEREIQRYIDEDVVSENQEDFNLLTYWQVRCIVFSFNRQC